jgi:hypothetical protein
VKETVIVRAYFLEYFLFFLDEKPYSKAETALVCVSHKASTVNQIKASHLSKCICIGPKTPMTDEMLDEKCSQVDETLKIDDIGDG